MASPLSELLFFESRDILFLIVPTFLDIKDFVRLDQAVVNEEERINYLEILRHFPADVKQKKFFRALFHNLSFGSWVLDRNMLRLGCYKVNYGWDITIFQLRSLLDLHPKHEYYRSTIKEPFDCRINLYLNDEPLNSRYFEYFQSVPSLSLSRYHSFFHDEIENERSLLENSTSIASASCSEQIESEWQFMNLTELILQNCEKIDSKLLSFFQRKTPCLEKLSLSYVKSIEYPIEEDVLTSIRLQVQELNLENSIVAYTNSFCTDTIPGFHNALRIVSITERIANDEVIHNFLSHSPNLESLTVSNMNKLEIHLLIQNIAQYCPSLHTIALMDISIYSNYAGESH
jgi:hypothetical protein